MIIDFYHDAAHGWIKVPLSKLKEFDIIDKISYYSYMRNDHAYLEEDCDAHVYLNALSNRGIKFKFRDHQSNRSRIRSYQCFNRDRLLSENIFS